ncbi:MAG: hypothetical protein ACR2NP_08710 [Pirellulaceae bacterium]
MKQIHFPATRQIGFLHTTLDDGRPWSFHGRYSLEGELFPDIENPGWEILGEACGVIEIPDDRRVLLEVLPDEARDLSPLAELPADALDGLWLGNTRVDDEQLRFAGGLTALRWIDVQNNGMITDTGVNHLRELTSLVSFGAHWTRISTSTMEWLATLPDINYVDIWGCEIPPNAFEAFCRARPDCQVRVE